LKYFVCPAKPIKTMDDLRIAVDVWQNWGSMQDKPLFAVSIANQPGKSHRN